jgi:signal transduction histidine kinase
VHISDTTRRNYRTAEQLEEEISRLQARVDELEAALDEPLSTIDAIRNGLVDAVIIDREAVPEVMTLESASEMYLHLAQRAAKVGTWQWNPDTGKLNGSEIFWSLIGEEPLGIAEFGDWERHIPLEEREGFKAVLEEAIEQECEFCQELRVMGGSGEGRYLDTRGCVMRSARGDERLVAGICMDITDRKRAEEDLRQADKRKDEFLAILGHELRNPLGAIKGAVQLLELDKSNADIQAMVVPILSGQVSHMQRLVDDIMDMARIVQGKIDVRVAKIALQDAITGALAMVEGLAKTKGCRFGLEMPQEPIVIHGDIVRLTQVFSNLMSNAIKFSPAGSGIDVFVEATSDEAIASVRDQGRGIDPELLPRVFDMFVQSNGAMDRSEGGLGLGLTVVRKLVELHGGRIEARSDGKGKGSEFRVYLPLAAG